MPVQEDKQLLPVTSCERKIVLVLVKFIFSGYESSYLSPGNKVDVIKHPLSLASLQGVLDVCSEQLPPLLDLGREQGARMGMYDFPYHRPSMLSSVAPDSVHMPESIGYVAVIALNNFK